MFFCRSGPAKASEHLVRMAGSHGAKPSAYPLAPMTRDLVL
jgi:hypothetical protein